MKRFQQVPSRYKKFTTSYLAKITITLVLE
jgi:hypothetical protein